MAKSKTALGVDVVGSEARIVVIETASVPGTESVPRVISSQRCPVADLARTFRSLPRRPVAVTCAVPLESSAIRILSLPPTTDENLERVVALEAESAAPFQTEDLALAFQMLGMTDQSRLEVLLAAARQTVVQEAVQKVNCLPWVSATVTVSAIAMINALQQVTGPSREQIVALLRVEEFQSELLLLDRQRVVVAQSIPVGCGAAVAAPEPVAVGAGASTGAPSGPYDSASREPGWIPALTQRIRYALQAVSYERGLAVERLYVCGAGAARPDIDWQLSQRLDLPLTVLGSSESAEPGPFAVAYGCALQAAGVAALPMSLAIPRVTVAREVEQRRQVRNSWVALAAALVISSGLIYYAMWHNKQQEWQRVSKLVSGLNVDIPKGGLDPSKLTASVTAIQTAQKIRVSPADALKAVNRSLPAGTTWLDDWTYNAQTGCVLKGHSTDVDGPQRTQFALLRESLFDEVTLDFRSEEHIGNREVWGFQVTCRLREQDLRRGGSR